MKPVPLKAGTDEEREQLKQALKSAGYGHFQSLYAGSVTDMKRGVRICWDCDSNTGYAYKSIWIEVRQEISKNVWNGKGTSKQVTTNYKMRGDRRTFNGHTPQQMFESIIAEANNLEGDKSITAASLKKGILQNVILDELRQQLVKDYAEWKGFECHFAMKASVGDGISHLRISVPPQSNNDKGNYGLESLHIKLADGRIELVFGDAYVTANHHKIDVAIPTFADPAFDPALLHTFAVQAIAKMDSLRDVCATKQREIDRLNGEIATAKDENRKEFQSIWQSTWYGD